MKKAVKWGLLAAVVVAVIAAIVAVVLVLVLKKKDEGPSERVMYFAMHLGDDGALYRNRYEDYKSGMCNLKMNVDNTRSSIKAMKSLTQKYSFILFTDKIETTAPMSSDEAIQKLGSIEPKAHESPFNQEAVLKEFTGRGGDNLLVYYIPCSFDYDVCEEHWDSTDIIFNVMENNARVLNKNFFDFDSEKVKQFVGEMKKAGLEKKILIVSNTRTEGEIRQLYEQNNVAGSDTENVAEKIIDFGHSESEKTTLEPKTSPKPGTTKTTPQKPSQEPTKPTRPTKPPGPSPNPNGLHCLFVGDLYNFGTRTENYDKEAALFGDIGYDFFEESSISRIGLWAYGHTNYPKKPDLSNMNSNFEDFYSDLNNMEFQNTKDPMNTETAIRVINGLQDDGSIVNCLVFFSARQDTQSLPKLDPQNKKFKRIVAVGYNNTDLSGVVGSRGVAVSVPYHYLDGDVATVLDAIMGRPVTKTTPKTVPTPRPTTSTEVPPMDKSKCLLVGDLYNFGREDEKYDIEADLISKIGYDFLLGSDGDLQLALWAYGYTQFSKTVNDSLKAMRKNYEEFEPDLDKLDFKDVSNPWSSESAIKAINEMYDSQKRVDCLVFFSAQQNPQSLPKLNPKNTKFRKIIAVGFNNVDLRHIVPANGLAFKVPFHYLDEDITPIVKAMHGRYVPKTTVKPTTKKTTTTAPPPPKKLNCLFVGDMYNFGSILDHIEGEVQFMSDLAYDFFGQGENWNAGLWAYGFTHFPTLPNLKNMKNNYKDFEKELGTMEFTDRDNYLTTSKAIEVINRLMDDGSSANCLVFFSAQKNTNILPRLSPIYKKWERIVAVGFNDTDLSGVVYGTGVAVRVPFHYLDEHVNKVMDAIMGRYVPQTTKRPVTVPTPRPTTPVPPGTGQNCLLVTDMSNFGRDMDKYEIELDLLSKVGYDFFEKSNKSVVALWAYGYTDYSKDVAKSLEKLFPNYRQLATELERMKLHETSSPLTTAKAIEAINAMVDRQNRVNCLVFISAQKDTGSLPKLNPRNTNIETIVAVGYDKTKLDHIVPNNGVALSIPLHFLDGDVDHIVNAMLRKPIPKTTTTKPTTTKPKRAHKCLFVGDLFSYQKNHEAYDLEADLLADVAHDLYNGYDGTTIGLWAYGYTNFSRWADSGLKNMRKNYNDFIKDLNGMVYYETDVPYSTAEAIEQLNQLNSSPDIVNCLVFFSAERDIGSLPMLYAVYLPLEVLVAVGLNDTDLSSRVHPRLGIPVSVPMHYLDKDVKTIVNAITKKEKPTPKPTTKAPTTTTEPPPSKDAVHCLFAGDLYNYGHNAEDYELEADLMDAVAHDLFEFSPKSSLGLWGFGYTNFSKDPATSLSKIRKNYADFKGDLTGFGYVNINDPLATKAAIEAINAMRDNANRINCLVFYSSTKSTSGLPKIDPEYLGLERIVAVGLNDVYLYDLVPRHGAAVSVPKHFLDADVTRVVNAIMRPVPKTTTTKKPTTTAPSQKVPDCLFVGDLYNYGANHDDYDLEAELMDAVAYDLFGVSSESSLALWAYGYTNFSKYPATSLANMRRNYNDFKGDLYGFGYVRTNNPLSTKGAIDALNLMRDDFEHINCLVFYSAAKNANELPKLELEKLKLEKIIAVGLDNANLDALLPSNGIAVSVPKHFVDSHVNQIVNAIVKKPVPVTTTKPVTTRRPTPTVPTEITPECLIVGDLYNFGDDMEAYEMEANLIDDVAYDLFGNLSPKSKLGLWMYGYTNVTSPGSALSRMRKTYNEFKKDLNDIEYIKVANPLKTKAAIYAINEMRDNSKRINCLVFLSAVKDTTDLPQVNPQHLDLERIVVVGLDNANLNALVPYNGVAVSVPKHFLDSDVKRVTDAIMGKIKPSTTPKPITTTAPAQIPPDCLIVGDLYNFGKNQDDYDLEAELLDAVGYDLFGVSPRSKLGLWLYGYKKLTHPNAALLRMRSNYTQFKKDLDDMDYEEMDNPLHTKAAIQAINDMRDDSNRINCLVFFSAVKDASNLPQINPKNAQIDKIVAVGLDNADLNVVLPSNGIAVSVPKHFLDSHVNQIVSAIMKKPAPVTTTPKPTTAPPQITPECLVVGDLYNFGKDQDAYDLEADLLDAVGYDVFGVSPGSKLGLWLYGYTKRTSPSSALQKMRSNYTQFKNDLDDMEYIETNDPVTTRSAIQSINELRDNNNRINCLVFLSAAKNAYDLPRINPQHLQLKRIVAVGLDNANLNALVPSNGVAVSVPKHFLDSDVKLVTDAIMGKVKPTTTPKPTTTTTTAPPPITPECLVVGDLYNFGKDEDAYDLEAELLDAVGYDVFGASPGSKLGLWLYGYTKRTSPSSALLKLRSNYTHFKKDLDDMEYIETNDPLTTRSAIYAINELRDNNNRINCLVFLSAVKDTKDLPQINPQHLQLKRIVAVGLDNANLNALVPNGIAVSVPKHFLDSHVKIITDAIIGKPKPTTTTTTTRPVTTTAPIKPYDCLIVGDLYNFGHNFDFYDIEADLIDAIGYDLFDVAPGSSLGLWAYGYSNYSTDPNTSLDKIRKNYNDFKSDVGKFNHYAMDDNVVSTKKAIDALNAMRNNGKRINCLVFLSGTRIADELPQLNPKNLKLDRIVAVGLNSQILDPLVAGRGIAVSVPEYFFDSHVKLVIDAIMGRVPPVTTTKPATTTTAPPKPMDCLLVGDLYNFGHNFEFYEIEADLIDAIGYDLFDLAPGSSLGLWAYGYSNYSTEPTTSLEKIRKTYNEFKADLHKFQHYVWDDYVVSTKKAIDALNAMRDNGKRINCLVFLSGTRIADEMPQLNPRQLKLERIVAVGLNSQILDPLVAGHGISVSVPEDFLDFHVKMVIDAIMGRIPPVTTTKPATTTTLPPTPVDCLLVGDLYNFNKDEEAYETEADLINAVAYDIFDTSPRSSLGLWAYGYTSFDKNPDTSLGKIRKNYDDFKADLADFEYKDIASPLTTKTAIDAINAMRDNSNRIKCLVFLSATKDTKGMPVIDPQHLNLERIVAVGLNNTNLDALVPYNRGISVRVPENFLDVHVKHVIDAMMGRVGPVTTRKPTTPTPPPITPHCLFVADFLNFGENVDDYDLEAALMGDVGYDLFDFDSKTSLGLWAFGHTDYSEEPSKSLEKMRNKYGDFEKDINAMEYVKKQNPMKTSKAIEAINAMRDNGNRINCLVFFSAIKDTKGLPQINPQHLNLERIVAVGLNETDLDDLVPANGAVLSIPYNFIDVDVKLITDTIFGRHKPTRKPTTIAPSTRPLSTTKRQPSNRRDCIVVADFISFGRDEDTYEQEINFISDLSYDFFALSNRTSMGLWVYGYTNFTNSSVNATLDNMKANFSEFSLELDRVEYFRIANPVTTRDAIEQINKLHVTNERANCMVFISGVTDTAGLPRINPDMPIDRFVAVGFNNTDLRRIIPNTPVAKAVPVPIHFLEQHVTSVLQEII